MFPHFESDGGRVQLRVSADERDRLDLHSGRPVAVRLPGAAPIRRLVPAVRADPPFA